MFQKQAVFCYCGNKTTWHKLTLPTHYNRLLFSLICAVFLFLYFLIEHLSSSCTLHSLQIFNFCLYNSLLGFNVCLRQLYFLHLHFSLLKTSCNTFKSNLNIMLTLWTRSFILQLFPPLARLALEMDSTTHSLYTVVPFLGHFTSVQDCTWRYA